MCCNTGPADNFRIKFLAACLLYFFSFPGNSTGQSLKGLKIYINPGHGGYDSNDRNVPLPPFTAGDTAGFWESKSNLVKGLYLKELLEKEGAMVFMSRMQNRTTDDLPLSAIAEEANANRVDFMISIHSNAYNTKTNYVLELFHGYDNNPILPQSMDLAILFWTNLFSNQVTFWTYRKQNVRGDKSFASPDWDGYGVLRPLRVPGLISEGSFHDYIPETYRLMNNDYKKLEAWHFFKAFCQYYSGNPGNKGKIAGFVKDSTRMVTDYSYAAGSTDQWFPVNGTRVTLSPGDLIYTVDNLNNGFFLFDNLQKGTYGLKFEAHGYTTANIENIAVDSAQVRYCNKYMYLYSHSINTPDHGIPASITLTLYPNPAAENLKVILPVPNGSYQYIITAVSGSLIMDGFLSMMDERGIIDALDLVSGSYILTIFSQSFTTRGLFIKR